MSSSVVSSMGATRIQHSVAKQITVYNYIEYTYKTFFSYGLFLQYMLRTAMKVIISVSCCVVCRDGKGEGLSLTSFITTIHYQDRRGVSCHNHETHDVASYRPRQN